MCSPFLRTCVSDSDGRTPDLLPFWKSDTTFHHSDEDLKDITKFRSTYPEFIGLENTAPKVRTEKIKAKVDALYNPQNITPGIQVRRASADGPATNGPDDAPAETRIDWFVRVRVKKFQLNGSFQIPIFLGPTPDDNVEWFESPHIAGTFSQFANSAPGQCGNCRESINVVTEGFIGLNHALVEKGYNGKSEAEIEEFIRDQISWRVEKVSLPILSLDRKRG